MSYGAQVLTRVLTRLDHRIDVMMEIERVDENMSLEELDSATFATNSVIDAYNLCENIDYAHHARHKRNAV